MTIAQLRKPLAMRPFRPFFLHTDEGGEEPMLLVESPDHARFTRDESAFVYFSADGSVVVIDLKHIAKLTHFIPQPVQPDGNGNDEETPEG